MSEEVLRWTPAILGDDYSVLYQDILRCASCGKAAPVVITSIMYLASGNEVQLYAIVCDRCKVSIPPKKSITTAITKWNNDQL